MATPTPWRKARERVNATPASTYALQMQADGRRLSPTGDYRTRPGATPSPMNDRSSLTDKAVWDARFRKTPVSPSLASTPATDAASMAAEFEQASPVTPRPVVTGEWRNEVGLPIAGAAPRTSGDSFINKYGSGSVTFRAGSVAERLARIGSSKPNLEMFSEPIPGTAPTVPTFDPDFLESIKPRPPFDLASLY